MALPGPYVYCTDLRLALLLLVILLPFRLTMPGLESGFSFIACTCAIGVTVLLSFSSHAIRLVFNRGSWNEQHLAAKLRTIWTFLFLLNPLELVWRLATAPFRVLPDIYIVGEVRCGTTTLAAHLKSLPGAHEPFVPWIHPLGDKETFYFSGHYWGLIHPYFYRMCFPLKLTAFFHRYVLRRPFFCYDACAQYLTAPWVPALLHKVTPNARILVCIRDPVQQNLSWWRYEQGAMAWGNSLELGPCSGAGSLAAVRLRYPPNDLGEAFRLSQSKEVEEMYRCAERLSGRWRLPDWAITWPNGQLSSFTQNGRFIDNIERYLRYFDRSQIEVIEVMEQTYDIQGVMKKLASLLPIHDKLEMTTNLLQMNPSSQLQADQEPTKECMDMIAAYYRPHNERLFRFLGRKFAWR